MKARDVAEDSGEQLWTDGVSTRKRLERMTDSGLFERLANAVLREVEPECRRLVETGVNEKGRTISGALDGVAYVERDGVRRMVAVHHTTCAKTRLRKKWLSAEDGDLSKTHRLLTEQRNELPGMEATLILTTNRDPSRELLHDVVSTGQRIGVEVKVFAGSALAHFLDVDAAGQWIRRELLGVEPARLSEELLRELCRRSLELAPVAEDPELWVGRELDQEIERLGGGGVRFVVGESGVGKTVACVRYLQRYIEDGGIALVLSDEILANSSSIEGAIGRALRDLQPSLGDDVGGDALSMAHEYAPFVLLAEDINKSPQPARLVERVSNWADRAAQAKERRWRMLCPVWPRTLALVGDKAGQVAGNSSLVAGSFREKEAIAAVQKRRPRDSEVDARALGMALGFEPLLIALHGDGEVVPNSGAVIQSYVERGLVRLAASGGSYLAGEYRAALRRLALEMVGRHRLEPGFAEVVAWFDRNPGVPAMLRELAAVGGIIRLEGPIEDQRIAFRHDRVRDHLLADAVAQAMATGELTGSVLEEPYFAEIIGLAAVRDGLRPTVVGELAAQNPLAMMCALRWCSAPTTDLERNLVAEAILWAESVAGSGESNRALRWAALRVVAECDGPHVKDLCARLDEGRGDVWPLRGQFRNGEILAGVELCAMAEPDVRWAGHVELIEHVKRKMGSAFDVGLAGILRRRDLPKTGRIGALRLAGFVGSKKLGASIRDAWRQDESRLELISDYLWASAQCCGEEPSVSLGPMMDAWAAMSDENERHMGSPRTQLGDVMGWAFRYRVPHRAMVYFLERATDPELKWPLTLMLRSVDHPGAIEFVVKEMARVDERTEETGGFSPFAMTAVDEWRRRQRDGSGPMSPGSRDRLREIWSNPESGRHVRRRALEHWCATEGRGDVAILRTVDIAGNLGSLALFERLRRGDLAATPELIEKLEADYAVYWWQAGRYIWTDALTACLDRTLANRSAALSQTDGGSLETDVDWILSERLAELPPLTAEGLLLKHWEGLRSGKKYIQAALYVASPDLLQRVAEVIGHGAEPERWFEHLRYVFGLRVERRRGITRMAQVKGLLPYLSQLSDRDIEELWRACNENGWFDWRRENLDPFARATDVRFVDDAAAVRELDRDLDEDGPVHSMDHWGKEYLGSGVSVDHMFEVVERWLADRPQKNALLKAAGIVTLFGKRRHVKILRGHALAGSAAGEDVIQNADFDVRLGSLE